MIRLEQYITEGLKLGKGNRMLNIITRFFKKHHTDKIDFYDNEYLSNMIEDPEYKDFLIHCIAYNEDDDTFTLYYIKNNLSKPEDNFDITIKTSELEDRIGAEQFIDLVQSLNY